MPLHPAVGDGKSRGRPENTDADGNYSAYLQAVIATEAANGPQPPMSAGPAGHLTEGIVQDGGEVGDKVAGAFFGAGMMRGGFLRRGSRPKPVSAAGEIEAPRQTPGDFSGEASAAVAKRTPKVRVGSPVEASAAGGGVNLDSGTARALVGEGSPVRHDIKAAIGERQMVMTETAEAEFRSAASRLAGPKEAARTERLMGRVNVVPDDPSARVAGLTLTKKVGVNDRLIFGTGDKMGIQTLTSDANFVRGAAAQGVALDAWIHSAFSFLGL